MASFFRGKSSSVSRARETIIKESLTNNLSECVKAIQFNHQIEECHHQVIGSNDLSHALCCALEAIFLHGLKDSFFKKAKSALTGDIDDKPEPSFWPLILVLSHSDSIKHIASLQQITTEIGQCRAWLRMALNDCLLSSYISTILRNKNSTKPFYNQSAFVRDSELLDVAQRFLEGIEASTQFELPINSSLLNVWPEDVLMLGGIWMPTMRSCPITAGVDVASTMKSEPEPKRVPLIPNRESTILGLGQMLAMDQEEAFNYIIRNTSDDIIVDDHSRLAQAASTIGAGTSAQNQQLFENPAELKVPDDKTVPSEITNDLDDSDDFSDPANDFVDRALADLSNIGNSLSGKTAWSTDVNEDNKILTESHSSDDSLMKSPGSKSVSSLVDDGYIKTPNLREVMRGLHKELKLTSDDMENISPEILQSAQSSSDDPLLEGLGFEVISKSPSADFDVPELKKMVAQLGSLALELGLDSQEYQCIHCHDMLGTTISKARLCAYSGLYYCQNCMDPDVFMIPAKVIHNWDFHRYPVSKRAALFLLEFQHQPMISMKKINPLIYRGVEEMATLQMLRIQLNFLRAYLFTCREPVIEELQKRVWPREYLYENVHLYSVSDLAQIPNGSLANQIQKVVSFALGHVADCWLCSQKGFICEVCNNTKVLYPFNIDTTYRCDVCSSVFHSKCLSAQKPCPKCERKKKRQAVSLVDAVHSNFA